jgi:hypothetical protein
MSDDMEFPSPAMCLNILCHVSDDAVWKASLAAPLGNEGGSVFHMFIQPRDFLCSQTALQCSISALHFLR